jgi:hypothetical protein
MCSKKKEAKIFATHLYYALLLDPLECVCAKPLREVSKELDIFLATYLYYTLRIDAAQLGTLECACISPFMR